MGYSVTQRIRSIKQPRGGYVKTSLLTSTKLNDLKNLNEKESIHPSLVGLAVDYMTRFMLTHNKEEAFKISCAGANIVSFSDIDDDDNARFERLLNKVQGLDDDSIYAACQLSGYDSAFRAGLAAYVPVDTIIADKDTIENIRIMVNRSLDFFKAYGPIVKDGFTMEGGYTNTVSAGDGDYLTKDTLWDFKVSRHGPTVDHTLQLLMYYLMGTHSIYEEFKTITKLGIFNPRLNTVYTLNIDDVSKATIALVEKEVIGY
jgi:hypothetical protein